MRCACLWGLLLLWQSSLVVKIGGLDAPEHLRFQRSLAVYGSGVTCVPLDVQVLSHSASAAQSDVRLFREVPGGAESETPYLLTESGPEPVADAELTPQHVETAGNELRFDLRMPDRPYSELKFNLLLHNFIATVSVTGRDARGRAVSLGSLPVFDLAGMGLGRWTSVQIGEANWHLLQLRIAFRTVDGDPLPLNPVSVLTGVSVPPSRARQTRYLPTVGTSEVAQRGLQSVAMLRVPAHVPVERVAIRIAPQFPDDFAREVSVTARAQGEPASNTEAVEAGEILRVRMPSGDPTLRPIDLKETAVDATLGATLAAPATVWVALNNGSLPPLPVDSVQLEMRERQLCFQSVRESRYVLRYGDPTLASPAYGESAVVVPAQPLPGKLGLEQRNPGFQPRTETRSYLTRHPELFWLGLLASSGLMCGLALHHVQDWRR